MSKKLLADHPNTATRRKRQKQQEWKLQSFLHNKQLQKRWKSKFIFTAKVEAKF